MDARAFDRITRTLSAMPSRRRLIGLVTGLAVAGPIAAIGMPIAEAKHKKKKKKHQGCKPNCTDRTCGSDGCGGECGQCAANQVCQGGSCCTPEPLVATCFHRCGTVANNCGQATSCPACSGARQCLSNGSCADGCATSSECAAPACYCGVSAEGPKQCVESAECDHVPQTCATTADCPAGQNCQQTGCGPSGAIENRCAYLC